MSTRCGAYVTAAGFLLMCVSAAMGALFRQSRPGHMTDQMTSHMMAFGTPWSLATGLP
jgi:hypothetical protein